MSTPAKSYLNVFAARSLEPRPGDNPTLAEFKARALPRQADLELIFRVIWRDLGELIDSFVALVRTTDMDPELLLASIAAYPERFGQLRGHLHPDGEPDLSRRNALLYALALPTAWRAASEAFALHDHYLATLNSSAAA